MAKSVKIRSPLRYPGGKQRLAKEIAKYAPKDFAEYREPFVGGGSVYFHFRNLGMSNVAWLNDIFEPVANFWNQLTINSTNVLLVVNNCKSFYGTNGKRLFESSVESLQMRCGYVRRREQVGEFLRDRANMAAWFFIINRISFSGLGLSGGYSQASFEGRFKDSHIAMLKKASFLLAGTKVTNEDYNELLTALPMTDNKNVFIYMDPPYDIKSDNLYGNRGDIHKTFDHEKFAQDCQICPYKWLITYNDSPRIRELFSFANIHEIPAKYSLNSTAKVKTELIITNY